MKRALWALLSPIVCVLAGLSYHYFNEHYVTRWWVHCKHCVMGEAPGFDVNDFTILFFSALCLLATAPLFCVFKQVRWPLMLIALAINSSICILFLKLNMWL
jgi:hypothetical protein